MDKQQEQTIIEMYSKRRPIKHIVAATGVSKKKIVEWLQENNLWTGHRFLHSYYDEFFFDKIDTEEKAYWLGFIYADGYVSNHNEVGIEIKSTDYKHLEKFKNSLKAERNVKFYHKNSTYGLEDVCRFSVNSAHMAKIMLNYFGSIHKTYEGHIPILSDEKLVHHLIRGFFDGDGSLTGKPKDDNHIFRLSIVFIGAKEILEYIEKLSGFSWSWSKRVKTDINNYQINCGRVKDSLSFLNYMYEDATIYLDRKYELYKYLLENRARLQSKSRV